MALTHLEVARDGLALLCGLQGLGTLAVDLNGTHATNPLWPAHARFHVVWQTANTALLGLLEVGLVLFQGPFQEQRFYLAAVLATVPMAGFFAASISRGVYGGALSDPNGIPPAKVKVFGRTVKVDLNTAVIIVALLTVVGLIAIHRL